MLKAADEQNVSRGAAGLAMGPGDGGGGEKERGIAQGEVTLVWLVSRPPVLEHEKEQVVYTPVKKATMATAAPGCYLG